MKRGTRRAFVGWLLVLAVPLGCGAPAGAGAGTPEATVPSNQAAESTRGPATPESSIDRRGLPTIAPESVTARVPTRVRIAELGIDLPVVAPAADGDQFPACGVAEYLPGLSRPGRAGSTFIYAHARAGMFLPILERSRVRDGRPMVGLTVEVFTSDDRRFTYEVVEVRRHVVSLEAVYRATHEQLVLQTSEGPSGTLGKTLLVAAPLDEEPATPAEARPEARPVGCR